MKTVITHAVIQHGFGVYGAGDSPKAACADASLWLGRDSDGTYPDAESVAARCAAATGVLGELRLLARADDPEEFDAAMRSQSLYVLTADGWVDGAGEVAAQYAAQACSLAVVVSAARLAGAAAVMAVAPRRRPRRRRRPSRPR